MRLRVLINPDAEEEIVISAKSMSDDMTRLCSDITRLIGMSEEIALLDGSREIFVPTKEILFFETGGNKVYAHTATDCFEAREKLFELESILPNYFVRASKSSIVNIMKISAIVKSLTGVSDVEFSSSKKKAVLSRMYYHSVRDRIEEIRLKKI